MTSTTSPFDQTPPAEGNPSPRADNALVALDGAEPHFPAYVEPRERWNGWLCPAFTRHTAEQVVTWLNGQFDLLSSSGQGDQCDRAEWDGDDLVHHVPRYENEPGYRPERLAPDYDGRYYLGAYSWTWTYAEVAT